jgi:hypothetical protein
MANAKRYLPMRARRTPWRGRDLAIAIGLLGAALLSFLEQLWHRESQALYDFNTAYTLLFGLAQLSRKK